MRLLDQCRVLLQAPTVMPSVFEAAKSGDTDALRELLAEDATACRAADTDGSGQTALHWAAFYGHVDAARLLLERSE